MKKFKQFACGRGCQQLKAHPCFTPIHVFPLEAATPQVKPFKSPF
jgi:hypothetical protein